MPYLKLHLAKLIMILMVMKPADCVTWSFFTGMKGKELTGHGYLTLSVKNVRMQCLAYCQRNPACWSVNYESSSTLTYSFCTLNLKDDTSYPQLLTNNPSMIYFRRVSLTCDLKETHTARWSSTFKHVLVFRHKRNMCPMHLYH